MKNLMTVVLAVCAVCAAGAVEYKLERLSGPRQILSGSYDRRASSSSGVGSWLSYEPDKICLGPLSLHADHCMIVVHNEMDRRQA